MQNPNYSEWKATLRHFCDYFILAAGAVIAAIALLSKQDKGELDQWPSPVIAVVSWLVNNNWWIVLFLAILGAIAKFTKERLDQTWIWAAVQAIIDRIARDAFGHISTGHVHHHRATLFRYCKYYWWAYPFRYPIWPWGKGRWPCSGWLVPVIRSGHTTQRTTTYFLAPDDADNAEGVAGTIWASNKEIALTAGASLQHGASDTDVKNYAEKTFITATLANRELSNKKVLAASFRGIPIEGKPGHRWGVLVLDSRDANAAAEAKLDIKPYAYCLGKLLERV